MRAAHLIAALASLTFCATARAETCAAEADVDTLAPRFVRALFPAPSEQAYLACDPEGAKCRPAAHRGAANAKPRRSTRIKDCRRGRPSVQACYDHAVWMTRAALDTGAPMMLNEAAVRARDLMALGRRGRGPKWLGDSNSNLLTKAFAEAGIDLRRVGDDCLGGSAVARNTCFAERAELAPHFRRLLEMGVKHTGWLAHGKRGQSAKAAALAWFEAGAAPIFSRMASRGLLDVDAGPGVSRVDLLASYLGLRMLTGEARDGSDELAHVRGLRGPAGSELFTAGLAFTLAGHAAYTREGRRTITRRSELRGDLRRFAHLMDANVATARTLGQCGLAADLHQVQLVALGRTHNGLLAARLHHTELVAELYEDLVAAADLLPPQPDSQCDWLRFDQMTYGLVTAFADEELGLPSCEEGQTHIDAEGRSGTVDWCHECSGGGVRATACLGLPPGSNYLARVSYPDEHEEVTTDYARSLPEGAWLLSMTMTLASLRGQYRELLSLPPFHYDPNDKTTATIANAGVPREPCFAEAGHSLPFAVPSVSCVKDDCTLAEQYIPYPIAARLCPEYVADLVGVEAGDSAACATPWDYVLAVQDFLETAEARFFTVILMDGQDGVAAEQTWSTEADEDLSTNRVDFASEALLLTVPAASALQHRASLAMVVGDLPAFDPEAANPMSAATFAGKTGLTLAEARLEHAAALLTKGLEALHDFEFLRAGRPLESMATLAETALHGLGNGSCDGNSPRCVRGTLHQRIGDLLGIYGHVAADRMHLIWRRAEGMSACGGDEGSCDAARSAECARACEALEQAPALWSATSAELQGLDAVLERHAAAAGGRLVDYLPALRTKAGHIAAELLAQAHAIAGGIDWLGFVEGQVVPSTRDVDTLLAGLRGNIDATDYDGLVRSLESRLREQRSFDASVQDTARNLDNALQAYCARDGVAEPEGCATDEVWSEDSEVSGPVNELLEDALCQGTITIDSNETYPIGAGWLTNSYYAESDFETVYAEYLAAAGVGQACPTVLAPDFEAWRDHTGQLPIALGEVERSLLALRGNLLQMELDIELLGRQLQRHYWGNHHADQAATTNAILGWVNQLVGAIVSAGAGAGPSAACRASSPRRSSGSGGTSSSRTSRRTASTRSTAA